MQPVSRFGNTGNLYGGGPSTIGMQIPQNRGYNTGYANPSLGMMMSNTFLGGGMQQTGMNVQQTMQE